MVTNLTITPVAGDGAVYRLSWSTTLTAAEVTFYVYRDGVLEGRTQARSWDAASTDGESPVYEVFDDAAAKPAFAWPGHATLCWYAAAGADYYLVEQFVGGAWAEAARVPDDGAGYFLWRSRPLADSTTRQFRVTPVGENGNAGATHAFSLLMVRVPDVPAVSYAYSPGTGAVTISAE